MSENNKIKDYHSRLDLHTLSRDRVRSSEDDHHMEFVDEVKGITFINDSRATRLTATRNSLESVGSKVVLITGGNDGDNDYSVFFKQVKDKVTAIIYLGNDSDKILKHYSRHSMLFTKAGSVKEAVYAANAYAESGDIVLFSPACQHCAEFDNYKTRGNEFKKIVREIAE